MIHSVDDMEQLVVEKTFLPFFVNDIPNLSIEEETPSELWFDDENPGPWEWKGPVIGMGSAAYGKFYNGKAGYVRLDWYPDFANYRRGGLSADEAIRKKVLNKDEALILSTIREHHTLLTTEIRKLCGYSKPHQHGPMLNPLEKVLAAKEKKVIGNRRPKSERMSMQTALTHLQMRGYLVIANFEYKHDKQGKRYGWGVARYCTPEDFYGNEIFNEVSHRSPEESYSRMFSFLKSHLPQATDENIKRLLQ